MKPQDLATKNIITWCPGCPNHMILESVKKAIVASGLKQTDFEGANLSHAIFIEAELIEANLKSANLHQADLTGANLTGANLKDTQLDDCIYSDQTIWPKGFDPGAAGAVKAIS